jgi:hypothetical protein
VIIDQFEAAGIQPAISRVQARGRIAKTPEPSATHRSE